MGDSPDLKMSSWPVTTARDDLGRLCFARIPAVDLAREFGTPLYVFDEETLRSRAASLRDTFTAAYPQSRVVFAGKAYISPVLLQILVDERVGLDIVSGGELYAGVTSGVDPKVMVFHGNNKSLTELEEAVAAGVGIIALDNELEIHLLDLVANAASRTVAVVLRLNPGVDPHTHAKMRTGATDSKFGFPIVDGQAAAAVDAVVATRHLQLIGYHAHVGSQIFDPRLVGETIHAIMAFASEVKQRYGIAPEVIIPGGGFGVADDASGADAPINDWAEAAAQALHEASVRFELPSPTLVVEPGRAIIGPAGIALYEVGARKQITGGRTYVSVDGGMSDNIRPSLYGAKYSAVIANRDAEGEDREIVTIAGKYCESGDILIEEIELPTLRPRDLLAVPMAGAYCLAMASNYNLAPRPAVVLVNNGKARLIRRRETYQDMLRADIFQGATPR